jgi:hypothetical protein
VYMGGKFVLLVQWFTNKDGRYGLRGGYLVLDPNGHGVYIGNT